MKYEIRSEFKVLGQIKTEFILPIKFSNNDMLLIFSEKLISNFFGISILFLSNSPFIKILIKSDFLLPIIIQILFQLPNLKFFGISIGFDSISPNNINNLFSLIN